MEMRNIAWQSQHEDLKICPLTSAGPGDCRTTAVLQAAQMFQVQLHITSNDKQ